LLFLLGLKSLSAITTVGLSISACDVPLIPRTALCADQCGRDSQLGGAPGQRLLRETQAPRTSESTLVALAKPVC
jgi:hypothetical protein